MRELTDSADLKVQAEPVTLGVAAPAAASDLTELSRIYDAELDYVWRSVERLGIPTADREDLVQEVFLVVHRKLADYDRDRPIRPWLFGITYRVVLGFKRRGMRREVPSELPPQPAVQDTPEELLEKSRRWQQVLRVLHSIPEDRRAVFIMHELDGQSVPRIAEALSIPLNTAYSRLRLARRDFNRGVESMTGEARHG